MISGTPHLPGRGSVAAFGVALVLATGPASTFAQSAQSPPNAKSTSSSIVFKIKRQVERGPTQPSAYPTQPQQEVRKLR